MRTVPGFDKNPMTAIQVLSEIGGDMSVFPTAKHLVSWAGCCPRNDQSNKKIKSTRISCAGSYFKPILVQVASALVKLEYPQSASTPMTFFRQVFASSNHYCGSPHGDAGQDDLAVFSIVFDDEIEHYVAAKEWKYHKFI